MVVHVSEKKKQEVKTLKELVAKYKVIGIIDLTNLPSFQFQKIKQQLKDSLQIRVTKKRLIKLVIEQSKEHKKGLEHLEKFLEKSMPALLFTNDDPFKLGKLLRKSKTMAAAKAGQIAPNDILVNAGPTPFPPGPIIGELGSAGLKTSIEGGKVAIKEDKILVKRGDIISQKAADVLSKLNIKPMEIGLNLVGVYDNGNLIDGAILAIDEKQYINDIKLAHINSFNLAIFVNYMTTETIKYLIAKASNAAEHISSSANIDVSKETQKSENAEEKKHEEPKIEDSHMEKLRKEKQVSVYSKEAEKVADDLITDLKDEAIKEQLEAKKEHKHDYV